MSERRLSEIAQRLVQPEDVTSSERRLENSRAGKEGRYRGLRQQE